MVLQIQVTFSGKNQTLSEHNQKHKLFTAQYSQVEYIFLHEYLFGLFKHFRDAFSRLKNNVTLSAHFLHTTMLNRMYILRAEMRIFLETNDSESIDRISCEDVWFVLKAYLYETHTSV